MTFNNEQEKANYLARAISKSKSVIHAVETKNYRSGQISPNSVVLDPNQALVESPQPQKAYTHVKNDVVILDQLNNSKLPPQIVESLRKSPPKPMDELDPRLGMNFLDTLNKPLPKNVPMAENNYDANPSTNVYVDKEQTQSFQKQPYGQSIGINELQLEGLKSIFRQLIEETMNKVFNERETLTETKKLDENIQIKIGDSIFGGKINKVKTKKNE